MVKRIKRIINLFLVFSFCFHSPYFLSQSYASPPATQQAVTLAKQFNEDLQRFDDSLDGKPVDRFSLDIFSLLQQKVLKKKKAVLNYDEYITEKIIRFVNWWDLSLEVVGFDEDIDVKNKLDFADANGFKASPTKASEYNCNTGELCRFRLSSAKEKKLNNFFISATTVATFGPYIVFIRPNAFNSEKSVQTISFIDLDRYNHLVGNEDIPVFEIPMTVKNEITQLKVQDGYLQLNSDYYIHPGQLRDLSHIYSVAFNLSANMVDPKVIQFTVPLIDSIKVYLDKIDQKSHDDNWVKTEGLKRASENREILHGNLEKVLQAENKLQQSRQDNADKYSEAQKTLSEKSFDLNDYPTVTHFLNAFEKSGKLDATTTQVAKALKQGQTLKAKFTKMVHALISPQPQASGKIKNAIALTVAYTRKAMGVKPAELLKQLALRKYATPALIATASLAYVFPDSFGTFTMQGLEVGTEYVKAIGTSLLEVGEAFGRSFKETTAIFWDIKDTVNDNLLSDGKWKQLSIGLGILGLSIIGTLGSYHVVQNTYNLIKDRFSPSWQGLVQRQEKIQAEYLQALSEAEAAARSGAQSSFSQKETEEVQKIINDEDLRQYQRSYLKRAFNKTKEGLNSVTQTLQNTKIYSFFERFKNKKDKSEQMGFWKAFSHVYLSFASYAKTVLQYTGIWNVYSALRYSTMRWGYKDVKGVKVPYLRVTPMLLASRILYPQMFKTIVQKNMLPTKLNGGLTSLWQWIGQGATTQANPEDTKKRQEALRKAESEITSIEQRAVKMAFKKAMAATVHFMKEDSELNKLFKSHDGVQSISDKDIRQLSSRNKTFIRLYFDRVFEESMKQVLKKTLNKTDFDNISLSMIDEFKALAPKHKELHRQLEDVALEIEENGEVSEAKIEDLKKMIVQVNSFGQADLEIKISDKELQEIVDNVAADPDIFGLAATEAKKTFKSMSTLLNNIKHEIAGEYDPEQDGSMKRYAIVQEKRKKPLAMARAVRAEVSNLLVTLPLDIIMLLALTAGITEGVMKPLQPEMFGPNSIGYLSQYSFYGSLLAGLFSGMMANSWVKLQMDARHDDAANFGAIPRSEKDLKKGFLSWFIKQTNQRDNSLWANWKEFSKIIWHNIPAYLLNAGVLNLLFIGFFDLDALVVGLATAFALPISGFTMKIEQGFEKSAYYDAKIFPEKYVSHPLAQKYIQKMAQKRRNRFNLFFDLFRNFIGTWEGNAYVTPTDTHPENRAFSRAIFGTLLAEKIINASQVAQDATQDIPVVNKVTQAVRSTCEGLLGHKGVIHTKFPLNIK